MSSIPTVHFTANYPLGGGKYDWNLDWGSEIIHQHVLPRLSPGAKVLDLCAGYGRGSICFVLHGFHVTMLDRNPDLSDIVCDFYPGIEGDVDFIVGDVEDLRSLLPNRTFDAVIMLESTVHRLKTQNYRTINDACSLLRPGGYFYVDGPSTLNYHFDNYSKYFEEVDRDTFMDECSCTGNLLLEPFCFFRPGELPLLLLQQGLNILFQDSALCEWQANKSVAVGHKPL